MTLSHNWDLIVIGGGAAGLWAAGTAASRGRRVLVLEKNKKAGVKILMSGGTRCNITHHCDIDGILRAFGRSQGRFLKPALHELPPSDVVSAFEDLGVATKVEETGKVFPVSNRAIDVRDALLRRLSHAGGQIRTGIAVKDVRSLATSQEPVSAPTWEVSTETESLTTGSVLLCCGGLSFPGCGTTGDGYAWARRVNHTIVPTAPALTPLTSSAAWVSELSGMTLPDASAQIVVPGVKVKDPRNGSRGGFLWTHFGCSGPVPMNVSRFVTRLDAQSPAAMLRVDLLPDLSSETLARHFNPAQGGRKQVASVIQNWLPKNLIAQLLSLSAIPPQTTLAELPKKSRLALLRNLKELDVPLTGTKGYPKAEVTSGGIKTGEVNPQTMESRLAKGLFLAGEILDIDGPIGGYNFQAAWSTGHAAGRHA